MCYPHRFRLLHSPQHSWGIRLFIQETIVKAFSNVGTLKNDNYARTWLIRILINECYSLVRKSSKFIPLENLADRQESESEKTKNYSELYTAVNSLKEELRLPVILYYIEDFSVKEIAQILEISEGAVQKRLARARGKLRQELQEVSI
ncbi:sigma-70 family RNA polymerase sigma factor [Blautia obeum]|uniref:sigma-70 family RNA polymerase sigma factor n=1 Tax=Blautia obeum TaxID=40520 RepID=UPI0035694211